MNKYREMSRIRILALILLVLFLPGCLGGKATETAAPPATSTASDQVEVPPAVATELPATNTPPAGEVASPTPEPVEETAPTETPLPTEEPVVPTPTSTEVIAPTNEPAPVLEEDVYEPIPGCARSRLHWSDIIRVAQQIEYVRIRSTPDTRPSDNIVRRLYRSELAQIIGQPVCNYGWILWPIRTADGTKGWVPESDGIDFWLANYNGYFFPTEVPPSR